MSSRKSDVPRAPTPSKSRSITRSNTTTQRPVSASSPPSSSSESSDAPSSDSKPAKPQEPRIPRRPSPKRVNSTLLPPPSARRVSSITTGSTLSTTSTVKKPSSITTGSTLSTSSTAPKDERSKLSTLNLRSKVRRDEIEAAQGNWIKSDESGDGTEKETSSSVSGTDEEEDAAREVARAKETSINKVKTQQSKESSDGDSASGSSSSESDDEQKTLVPKSPTRSKRSPWVDDKPINHKKGSSVLKMTRKLSTKRGSDKQSRVHGKLYDDLGSAYKDLDDLHHRISTIRSLSARLLILSPNDFSVMPLSLQLRSSLQDASSFLVELDGDILRLWKDEQRVQEGVRDGTSVECMSREDLKSQYGEMKDAVDKFVRRVKRIKNEADGEAKDRLEKGVNRSPEGLNDWLFGSEHDVMALSKHSTILPSRYVVENPFTILSKLTAGMSALHVPPLVDDDKKWPSSSSSAKSSKSSKSTKSKSSSKRSSTKKSFKGDLEKGYGRLESDEKQAERDIKKAARFGKRERWIVFLALALIPAIIAIIFVEREYHIIGSSTTDDGTSSSTASTHASSTSGNVPVVARTGEMKVVTSASVTPSAQSTNSLRTIVVGGTDVI